MMKLAQELDAIRARAEKQIPRQALDLMHRATQELKESGAADQVISEGEALPHFSLPNQRGDIVSSAAMLSSGPLVLTVYRGLW